MKNLWLKAINSDLTPEKLNQLAEDFKVRYRVQQFQPVYISSTRGELPADFNYREYLEKNPIEMSLDFDKPVDPTKEKISWKYRSPTTGELVTSQELPIENLEYSRLSHHLPQVLDEFRTGKENINSTHALTYHGMRDLNTNLSKTELAQMNEELDYLGAKSIRQAELLSGKKAIIPKHGDTFDATKMTDVYSNVEDFSRHPYPAPTRELVGKIHSIDNNTIGFEGIKNSKTSVIRYGRFDPERAGQVPEPPRPFRVLEDFDTKAKIGSTSSPYSQERGSNLTQLPREEWEKLGRVVEVDGGKVRIFRGSPTGAEIQPGDMVVLDPNMAVKYTQPRNAKGQVTYAGQDYDGKIRYLDVDPSHINLARDGSHGEFFYDPPTPANEIIPETKVETVVQKTQPTPVKRTKKIKDEEVQQRKQSEVAAKQQIEPKVKSKAKPKAKPKVQPKAEPIPTSTQTRKTKRANKWATHPDNINPGNPKGTSRVPDPYAAKKAVQEVVSEAQHVRTATQAVTQATDSIAEGALTKTAREGIKKLQGHAKTALSHAGWGGAGAAGLFAFFALSRADKKNSIDPRKRGGRVREHPRTDTNGRSSTAGGAAMLGAIAAGISLVSKKSSPAVRALLGIGGAVVGGLGVSRLYRDDPSVAALGMAGAGAAASLAYILVGKQNAVGLKSLRNFSAKQGPKAAVDAFDNALQDARKHFPGLSGLLSNEAVALGAGIVTLPVAHSIMVKHFAAEKRRSTDHAEVAFLPAWQDNKAGHKGMRKSNSPLFAYNSANTADVNFSGSVNSYYNSADVFHGV